MNSSNTNDTLESGVFTIYKLDDESCPYFASNGSDVTTRVCDINVTLGENLANLNAEAEVETGSSLTADWDCFAGDYRIATLTTYLESLDAENATNIRVSVYSGDKYLDILHNYSIGPNATRLDIAILRDQLLVNESGYCKIKIDNIGEINLLVDYLSLKSYYTEAAKVIDIIPKIDEVETRGLETDDELFNVTVKIKNSIVDTSYTISVDLNITNSSNDLVNYSTFSSVSLPANSTIEVNFTHINTSTWSAGNYNIKGSIRGGGVTFAERDENLTFRDVNLTVDTIDYMCNKTTEIFNVTLYHPFVDTITYNVTLEVPSGWAFSPNNVTITANSSGYYNATFILNSSSSTGENVLINVTANYTYPGNTSKLKRENISIEENNSIPILEVIRETPENIAADTPFTSRLIIYNKGCAEASSISFIDNVSAGWVPFGLTLDGATAGTVDLPNRKITLDSSDFGTIDYNEYKTIEYSILSHSTAGQAGTLRYNLEWGNRNVTELLDYDLQTSAYAETNKHLDFDLLGNKTVARKRSADPNEVNFYNLSITNVGNQNIEANTWNITLKIPSECNVTGFDEYNVSSFYGFYDNDNRKINWQIGALAPEANVILNFSMNCTTSKKYTLIAEGINNSITTETFSNGTGIGCSGSSCSDSESFTFSNPDKDYEKISRIDFFCLII